MAISVFAKAVLPTVVDVYYACIRNQKTVVENVRRQLLPTVLAFLANSVSRSLASVQRGITFPLSLRVIKQETPQAITNVDDDTPEKSVDCCVLAQPDSPDKIVADVIFIHGLHGALDKTWKQLEPEHSSNRLKQQMLVRCSSEGSLEIPQRKVSLKRSVSDDTVIAYLPNKVAKINNNTCVNYDMDQKDSECKEEDEEYSECWPRDWLPKDCPGVRVIAVNYTTDILWRPMWIKKRNR